MIYQPWARGESSHGWPAGRSGEPVEAKPDVNVVNHLHREAIIFEGKRNSYWPTLYLKAPVQKSWPHFIHVIERTPDGGMTYCESGLKPWLKARFPV